MNLKMSRSLLAGMAAMAFAAGAAAVAPERDPGQQSPNYPSNSPSQQASDAATRSNMQDTAGAISNDSKGMTGTSLAQEKFSALDVNTDGVIDKQEASASKTLAAEFDKLDTNKDGKLSLTELSAAKNLASIKVDNTKKNTKGY